MNSWGIGVYPDYMDPSDVQKARAYVREAAALGCSEVFSSLHLPELDYRDSLARVADLSKWTSDLATAGLWRNAERNLRSREEVKRTRADA